MACEPDDPEDAEESSSEELGAPGLDPKVQQKLGEMFQLFCDEMVKQPIPRKFLTLLDELKAKEREAK